MQQEVIEKNNILKGLIESILSKDNEINSKDLIECYITYINIVKDIYKNKKEAYEDSLKNNRVINKELYHNKIYELKNEVDSLLNDNIIFTDHGNISLYYFTNKIYSKDFDNENIDLNEIFLRHYDHRNIKSYDSSFKDIFDNNFNIKYKILSISQKDSITYKYFKLKQKFETEKYKSYKYNTYTKEYDMTDWNKGLENKFINYKGTLDSYQIFYLYTDYINNIHYTYKYLYDNFQLLDTLLDDSKVQEIKQNLKKEAIEKVKPQKIYLKNKDCTSIEMMIDPTYYPVTIIDKIYTGKLDYNDLYFSIHYKENDNANSIYGEGFILLFKNKKFEIDKEKHKLLQKNKA